MENEYSLYKMAFLYPTMRCNLKCKICYSGAHKDIVTERLEEELTLEDYKIVIDKLYKMGVRLFDLSGGEPFLCSFIYDLVLLIKSYEDTEIYIVSNGTFIEENLLKISEILENIDRFQISIDSCIPEIHDKMRGAEGTFLKALNGMKLLQSTGYSKIGINSVVTNTNEESVTQLLQFAKENGLSRIHLLRLIDVEENGMLLGHNIGRDKYLGLYQKVNEWIEANREASFINPLHIEMVMPGYVMKDIIKLSRVRLRLDENIRLEVKYDPIHGCPAYKSRIVVTSYGEMTGCTGLVKEKKFYCADIMKDSIDRIQSRFLEQQRLLRKREEEVKNQAPCNGCEAWNSCKGGCPATVSSYYDSVWHPDPTCMKCAEAGIS